MCRFCLSECRQVAKNLVEFISPRLSAAPIIHMRGQVC